MLFSFPWNENTIYGYTATIFTHTAFGETYLISNGSTLLLFVSICWYHRAFFERFQYSIRKLDQPNKLSKTKDILCDVVCFHNTVKE